MAYQPPPGYPPPGYPPPGQQPGYGSPQGQQGYPQQGYGPPGHPQGYGPPPPQKKGGARVIIALVSVGVLLVLIAGGVGAYFWYSASQDEAIARAQQEQQQKDRDQAQAAAQNVQQAAEQKQEREQDALRGSPNRFIHVNSFQEADSGFVNHYRQLASVTILNSSHFPVQGLQGTVTWKDDQGNASCGSGTFSLVGSIVAGDTKTFSVGNGTMTSSSRVQCTGTQGSFSITQLAIVN